jgi:hypothetical protein
MKTVEVDLAAARLVVLGTGIGAAIALFYWCIAAGGRGGLPLLVVAVVAHSYWLLIFIPRCVLRVLAVFHLRSVDLGVFYDFVRASDVVAGTMMAMLTGGSIGFLCHRAVRAMRFAGVALLGGMGVVVIEHVTAAGLSVGDHSAWLASLLASPAHGLFRLFRAPYPFPLDGTLAPTTVLWWSVPLAEIALVAVYGGLAFGAAELWSHLRHAQASVRQRG